MYIPPHFEESRPQVLHALMRARPLATLVMLTSSGLLANHLPLQLQPAQGACGVLRGHVARANPAWKDIGAGTDALAIFQGAGRYISPSWYPSKREHGKVVPTWNYCAVHAWGRLRIHDDAAWLRGLVRGLTEEHEADLPQPWSIDDAPPGYLAAMLEQIVGIELEITRIEGKWKVSQNQPAANRAGAAEALDSRNRGEDAEMAELIRTFSPR